MESRRNHNSQSALNSACNQMGTKSGDPCKIRIGNKCMNGTMRLRAGGTLHCRVVRRTAGTRPRTGKGSGV